jgi:hypothetical protein
MGYDLLQSPIVQLYLLILGVAFLTVIWESARNPQTPKDHFPAESGPPHGTAKVRGDIPVSGAWALREGPSPAGGNKNQFCRCRGRGDGRISK